MTDSGLSLAQLRGRWLQRAREDAGITQAVAAEHLKIHRQTLSRIERGVHERLDYDLVRRMLGLYGRLYAEYEAVDSVSDSVSRGTGRVSEMHESPSLDVSPASRQRLAPRAYERVYGLLQRMEAMGVSAAAIEEAERLFTRDRYATLYSGKREATEEEQLQVVEATWRFIRDVILATEGKRL